MGVAVGGVDAARRSVRRSEYHGPATGLRAGARAVLRDLDPHLGNANTVPTQRLHGNWPDGLRRQVARHFYGMSPAQILEEEEKERQRDLRRTRTGIKDLDSEPGAAENSGDTEPASPTAPESPCGAVSATTGSPKNKARVRALDRCLARGVEGGVIAHSLEVRIRNVEQPERVVVSRKTEQARAPRIESAMRPCMLLDAARASPHKMSCKY